MGVVHAPDGLREVDVVVTEWRSDRTHRLHSEAFGRTGARKATGVGTCGTTGNVVGSAGLRRSVFPT